MKRANVTEMTSAIIERRQEPRSGRVNQNISLGFANILISQNSTNPLSCFYPLDGC